MKRKKFNWLSFHTCCKGHVFTKVWVRVIGTGTCPECGEKKVAAEQWERYKGRA